MSAVQNLMLKLQAVRNEPRPGFLVGRRANVEERQKAIVRTVATSDLSLENGTEAHEDLTSTDLPRMNRLTRVDASGAVVRQREASTLSWESTAGLFCVNGVRSALLHERREVHVTDVGLRIAGLVAPPVAAFVARDTTEAVVANEGEDKIMKLLLSNLLIRSSLILHRQLAAAARMQVARYLATVKNGVI